MQKIIRTLAFSLMGMIVFLLIAATVVEQVCGTDVAIRYVYTAPWAIALWALAVVFGVWHLVDTLPLRSFRSLSVFALHFSFVIILAGAFITHLFGTHEDLHLRVGEATEQFGFPLSLQQFSIVYYPGTNTAEDYCADLSIGQVSMNHPILRHGYRFFLSSYDSDEQGCVFIVRHDPVGTCVTYCGYAFLLLSILLLAVCDSGIISRLKQRFSPRAAALSVLLLGAVSLSAEPQTIPKRQANELGQLCVYYDGRIEPLSCIATSFTEKLYGKSSYHDYTAEQVYAGWLFAPYTWLDEPIIRLKSSDAKQLHFSERYVSYNQLFALRSANVELPSRVAEKYALVGMLLSGELMRIYPYCDSIGGIEWYSYNSRTLPKSMPHEDWIFIKRSIDYMGELVFQQDYEALSFTIQKIRLYQQKRAGVDNLPSPARLRAEQLWSAFAYTKPFAMVCMVLGLLFFCIHCLMQGRNREMPRWGNILAFSVLCAAFLFLTAMLSWRWYISGYIPLSNGHETMQSLAWFILLLGIVGSLRNLRTNRYRYSLGGVLLLAAMPLMVSMMSASNPQITHLMPVLQSPLLSLHVSVIMLSFALLAFLLLNGVVALFSSSERRQGLMTYSLRLLRPAVCLLAIGIFLGAVWANVSWGRYWGWDPKEVWALITLLIYAAPLHSRSLPAFRKPLVFHIYCILAFLSVLFTYFGVNFLLGGLHSYA